MKHGKHSAGRNKTLVLILTLALVITAVISGTVAVLVVNTGAVDNKFTSASVSTKVNENYTITNTGTTRAYIRAAVVVTWQDDNGNVYGTAPVEGDDYTISMNTTDWQQAIDGFWYHTAPVTADAETKTLINSITLNSGATPPADYSLHLEIVASGIQSIPDTTVTTVWSSGVNGINADDTLMIKTA